MGAKSSVKSFVFFGVLGRLCSLFAASVNRWKILNVHVKFPTLDWHNDTRYEEKIASVKALRYRSVDAHDSLTTVAEREQRHDPEIAHETVTVSQRLKDLGF
jgi:hypothetical protein